MFVGQEKLLSQFEQLRERDSFPRLILLTGDKGSGKKTMAKRLANEFLCGYEVYPGNSVDAVRQAIESSYKCSDVAVYIFSDADSMSLQAKNSLLKITEEPPQKAYFILTLERAQNTLPTIVSRGTEFRMDTYSYADLRSLCENNDDATHTALKIATNPGQLAELFQVGPIEFYNFCLKVVRNIQTVSGVNAFKIANNIKFKEDGTGYNIDLFFEGVRSVCLEQATKCLGSTDAYMYTSMIWVTSKYQADAKRSGLKKDSTFDMWILAMREVSI